MKPAVDYFITQLPEKQRQIEAALSQASWSELKELVHDLKGSAGGVGLRGLLDHVHNAQAMERAVRFHGPQSQEIEVAVEAASGVVGHEGFRAVRYQI